MIIPSKAFLDSLLTQKKTTKAPFLHKERYRLEVGRQVGKVECVTLRSFSLLQSALYQNQNL